MSNEMKLIEALCNALGFEVKTTLDWDRREESPESAKMYLSPLVTTDRYLESINGEYVIDEDGYYTSALRTPDVSFEVVPVGTGGDS